MDRLMSYVTYTLHLLPQSYYLWLRFRYGCVNNDLCMYLYGSRFMTVDLRLYKPTTT